MSSLCSGRFGSFHSVLKLWESKLGEHLRSMLRLQSRGAANSTAAKKTKNLDISLYTLYTLYICIASNFIINVSAFHAVAFGST